MRPILVTVFAVATLTLAARPALAFGPFAVRDYRVNVGAYRVGFVDMHPGWYGPMDDGLQPYTLLDAGPLGRTQVPFSAATGSALAAGAALLLLIGLAFAWLGLRRLRQRRVLRAGKSPPGFEVRATG